MTGQPHNGGAMGMLVAQAKVLLVSLFVNFLLIVAVLILWGRCPV